METKLDIKRTENANSNGGKKISNIIKKVYTALLCFANLTYGAALTCMTPALLEFSKLLNTPTEKITHYYTLFAIGVIIGSLSGFLFKYINRQLTLSIILLLFALATSLQPQCPSYLYLYFCGFISGLGAGTLDTVQTVWLIEMWKHKSGSILQLSECCYGIGCFIGPLIVENFLSDSLSDDAYYKISIGSNYRINLTTPFLICGFFQFIASLLSFYMYIFHRYKPLLHKNDKSSHHLTEHQNNFQKQISVKSNKNNPQLFENVGRIRSRTLDIVENDREVSELKLPKKTFLAIGAIGFATMLAVETAYIDFSPTFFQNFSPDSISAQDSAILLSSMTASYTITRAISIFIAIKVQPKNILIYHYFILFTGIILLYFSSENLAITWTANIIFGIGISVFWSATFSHIEQYFEITDRVGTIYISLLGLIQAGTQFIEGPFLDSYPIIVVHYCLIAVTISLVSFITIRVIVWKSMKNCDKSDNNFPFVIVID